MAGPANEAIQRLQRKLTKLDNDRAELVRAIEALRPAAEAEGLQVWNHGDTVASMQMHPAIRKKYSEGATSKDSPTNVQRFLSACHASKFVSMRGVSAAVGKNQAQISQMLRGDKPTWRAFADKIEELIGFKATRANWPDLRDE